MRQYQFIIIPLLVGAITQIIKLSIDKIQGNLNIRSIFLSYGGMPSAHSAFSVSITTIIWLTQGIDSVSFAIAFVFTVIIVRDAISFRNILGNQGKILNLLIHAMPESQKKNLPHFMERVGHSALEVFVGALLGVFCTYVLFIIFNM